MAKTNKKQVPSPIGHEEPIVERVRPPKDDKGRYTEVDMSMEELGEKNLKTKSSVIRYLSGEGYSPSAIARFLGIRYQHVRNVLTQVLKRPAATTAEEGGSAEG